MSLSTSKLKDVLCIYSDMRAEWSTLQKEEEEEEKEAGKNNSKERQ